MSDYLAPNETLVFDPFSSDNSSFRHPNPSIHSQNNYRPINRPLSIEGREENEDLLVEDEEILDLSNGRKGTRPLSQSNNTAYWNPIAGGDVGGAEFDGPRASETVGGSPYESYSNSEAVKKRESAEEDWNGAYESRLPFYKTRKALIALVIVLIVILALSIGLGVGLSSQSSNHQSDQARLSSMSSLSARTKTLGGETILITETVGGQVVTGVGVIGNSGLTTSISLDMGGETGRGGVGGVITGGEITSITLDPTTSIVIVTAPNQISNGAATNLGTVVTTEVLSSPSSNHVSTHFVQPTTVVLSRTISTPFLSTQIFTTETLFPSAPSSIPTSRDTSLPSLPTLSLPLTVISVVISGTLDTSIPFLSTPPSHTSISILTATSLSILTPTLTQFSPTFLTHSTPLLTDVSTFTPPTLPSPSRLTTISSIPTSTSITLTLAPSPTHETTAITSSESLDTPNPIPTTTPVVTPVSPTPPTVTPPSTSLETTPLPETTSTPTPTETTTIPTSSPPASPTPTIIATPPPTTSIPDPTTTSSSTEPSSSSPSPIPSTSTPDPTTTEPSTPITNPTLSTDGGGVTTGGNTGATPNFPLN